MGGVALKMPAIWPKMLIQRDEQVHASEVIQ
jgi:hypothetical protein